MFLLPKNRSLLIIAAITKIYLRAVGLHLRLSAFFDNPSAKHYRQDLLGLYRATTSFLDSALSLKDSGGPVLGNSPNYIFQMVLAAGFTMFKLCNSFFANHIDMAYSKQLFTRTIWAIRAISVTGNDLPDRMAEVLAQMWKHNIAKHGGKPIDPRGDVSGELQLKVTCRMSMSLVYDSVWRWREEFQPRIGRSLEGKLYSTFLLSCSIVLISSSSQHISKTRQTQTAPLSQLQVPN